MNSVFEQLTRLVDQGTKSRPTCFVSWRDDLDNCHDSIAAHMTNNDAAFFAAVEIPLALKNKKRLWRRLKGGRTFRLGPASGPPCLRCQNDRAATVRLLRSPSRT